MLVCLEHRNLVVEALTLVMVKLEYHVTSQLNVVWGSSR